MVLHSARRKANRRCCRLIIVDLQGKIRPQITLFWARIVAQPVIKERAPRGASIAHRHRPSTWDAGNGAGTPSVVNDPGGSTARKKPRFMTRSDFPLGTRWVSRVTRVRQRMLPPERPKRVNNTTGLSHSEDLCIFLAPFSWIANWKKHNEKDAHQCHPG